MSRSCKPLPALTIPAASIHHPAAHHTQRSTPGAALLLPHDAQKLVGSHCPAAALATHHCAPLSQRHVAEPIHAEASRRKHALVVRPRHCVECRGRLRVRLVTVFAAPGGPVGRRCKHSVGIYTCRERGMARKLRHGGHTLFLCGAVSAHLLLQRDPALRRPPFCRLFRPLLALVPQLQMPCISVGSSGPI